MSTFEEDDLILCDNLKWKKISSELIIVSVDLFMLKFFMKKFKFSKENFCDQNNRF